MSVINDVLKDLSMRNSQFTPLEFASVEGRRRAKPLRAWRLASWSLLTLAIVAALLWWLQTGQLASSSKIPVQVSTEVTNSEAAALPVVTENPALQNSIVDLQIQESVLDMSLTFALGERVTSYLKERTENSFIYHLKDIQSDIIAPRMQDNRWIKSLAIEARDGGVDVSFKTLPGIQVETRQQSKNGLALWSIKLKKAPAPVAQVVTASRQAKVVETPVVKESKPEKEVVKEVDPVASPARVVKLEINAKTADAGPEEQLQQALALLNKQRWYEAQTRLQGLLGGAQDLVARGHLLRLYQLSKQQQPYLELARESVSAYPAEGEFKTEYARALYQRSAYQAVIDLLLYEADHSATQFALLAASYQRLSQHHKAIDYYQRAIGLDNRDPKSWIGLAISQEQSAQPEAALQSYRVATQLGALGERLGAFVAGRTAQLEQVIN